MPRETGSGGKVPGKISHCPVARLPRPAASSRQPQRDKVDVSDEDRDTIERATRYREIAAKLRRLAEAMRFDLRRRQQLEALADGFERAAVRIEAKSA